MQDSVDMEPLKVSDISILATAQGLLRTCWEDLSERSLALVPTFEHFLRFVREVLSFDFRSIHQRSRMDISTIYHVELFGLQFSYTVTGQFIQLHDVR